MPDRIRVLHVDDDPDFADLAATFLERDRDRFDVETAHSAREGLDLVAEGEFDCVVSDYDMPDLNGIEFLEAVRAAHPDLPFVLFTGKGSEEIASDAITAGVSDYLQKGTGTEQYDLLAARIDNAVGQYRAERELERLTDLFESAQRIADVGAWEWYPGDETGYYSEGVYEIYGVDARPGKEPMADIDRFYHPEDRETIREAFTRAVEAGEPYDVEVRIESADGERKWVRTLGDPELVDGECVRVHGTIQDVTERKRRERALARRRDQAETLHEVTRDLFRAESERRIAELAVEALEEILEFRLGMVRLYDPDEEGLVPVAYSDATETVFESRPTFTADSDSLSWRAFESGEPATYNDVTAVETAVDSTTPLRSLMILPLGPYGTLNAGSTRSGEFTESDLLLTKTLARNVEAAIDRVRNARSS